MLGGRSQPRVRTVIIAALFLALAIPQTAAADEGEYPIVLIPGWHGNADSFREMIPHLEAAGFTVLDFDAATPGTQAMGYEPSGDGQHIPYVAGKIVEERIQQALADNGYAANQKVDIIAHSMGGLVARFLVEQPGADVDYWSESYGWYGDGVADVRTDWADRVDDLVMLGTPSHGTWEAWVPTIIGGFGKWNPTGSDMRPGSPFLARLGNTMPAGEDYAAIGGDPQYLQWLQYDHDGDGVSHGFDGVVPAESPYVEGATMDYVAGHHGELVTTDQSIDLVITHLGRTSYQTGIGDAHLVGELTVRLEAFTVASDHDGGSTDDYWYDIHVDPDGDLGPSGYILVGSLAGSFDGPGTRTWGNDGPNTPAIQLPGTHPTVDVKVVVKEDDTSWGGGWESVSTHYLDHLMLSEDIDGQDYYAATATDSKGGTNEVRISLNGVTSNVAETRHVTLGFSSAYIQNDHDWGNGEVQFTINAGRAGYTSTYYRGTPADDSHYSRSSGSWVDVGYHSNNKGMVESETIFDGRMHKDATLRYDLTYWEDDGGWSGRDGGNMYYLEAPLGAIGDGTNHYSGTAHGDWDVYIYVTKPAAGPSTASFGGHQELEALANPLGFLPDGPDDPPGLL